MKAKIGLGPISETKIGLGPILKTKIGRGPILKTKIGIGAILGKPPVSSCTGCLILMLNFMLFAIPIFGEKAIRKLFKSYFAKTALLGRSVERGPSQGSPIIGAWGTPRFPSRTRRPGEMSVTKSCFF